MRLPLLLLAAAALAGCDVIDPRAGAAFKADGRMIALSGGDGGALYACFNCHGANGEGDGAATPRLAGLSAGYLEKQLGDYAEASRAHKLMGPIAKALDDKDRRAVAAYYAALAASSAPSASPAPADYIEHCAACHGPYGEGVGPANPALAGQPAAYVRDQLWRWKRGERRNDPRGVMTAAVAPLDPAAFEAIATWLSTQSSARTPQADAASLSAAEEAGRRLAASHAERHRAR